MISDANKRIARNTVLLYVRIFLAQIIALYTSRKVLEVLGLEDFGIQAVVGGVVGMLTFINGSMAVATSRYLSIELGKKDFDAYNRLFSMAVIIHFLLGALVVIAAETFGLWMVNAKLVIPADRIFAANCVYQMTIVGVFISIIQTPYMASITAHEHMGIYAYIGMGHSIVYLFLVIALSMMVGFDNLILLSAMMLIVGIIEMVIYRVYSIRHFPHCRFRRYWNLGAFREMLGFTGWNMFGTIAWTIKWSGADILLNLFGGPVANAAAGVANKVNGAISSVVSGFSTAMSPQVTISYGAGDMQRMHRLIITGSKLQCLILAILAVPVSIEIGYLLDIWLVEVPPRSVWFLRIIVLENLFSALCGTLITGLLATGKIKWYQIITGTIMLLNLPIAYVLLWLGLPLITVFIVSLGVCVIAQVSRLIIARNLIGLSIKDYLKNALIPSILVITLAYGVTLPIYWTLAEGFIRLLLSGLVGVLSVIIFSYYIGLNQIERSMVTAMVGDRLAKLPFKRLLIWKKQKQLG